MDPNQVQQVVLNGEAVRTVGTDEWWMAQLSSAIRDRNTGAGWNPAKLSNDHGTRPGLTLLSSWLRGEQPLPEVGKEGYVEAWAKFLRLSRTNYAELITSSRTERIVPLGWRTPVDNADDTDGDEEAERLATHTDLRNRISEAVQDMTGLGIGYLMAGADQQEKGKAIITRESPLYTMVAEDSANRPRAGLRMVHDPWTNTHEAWLYMARDGMFYQRMARRSPSGQWQWDPTRDARLPRFPLVPLPNYLGIGEFERHLDALTRINDTMFTRLVLTKLQAHRQRALEREVPKENDRYEVDVDVDQGDFVSGPDALWELPPGSKLWESATADLSQVRLMVEDDVKSLAAVTKTPVWQLLPGSQNQSATGSERAHEGFLALVEDRRHRVDVALAKVLANGFHAMGDSARADAERISTIWAPTERYSLLEKSQAFSAMYGKWPFDELAVDVMQVRPSELQRLNAARAKDTFYSPVTAPTSNTDVPQQDSATTAQPQQPTLPLEDDGDDA